MILFVILTQDMNKRMQYLVEGIAKDIIAYLMEDNGCDLSTALREFYRNSHLKTPKSSV